MYFDCDRDVVGGSSLSVEVEPGVGAQVFDEVSIESQWNSNVVEFVMNFPPIAEPCRAGVFACWLTVGEH